MPGTIRTRLPLALLMTALLVSLTACGGGGGGGGGGDGGGEPKEKGFRVLETEPSDSEFAVARDATIEVVFSEELREDTITHDSLKVSESFTGRVLTGDVTVDRDGKTVRLEPFSLMALNTEYRILVTTDVENRFGERIRKDFTAYYHTVVTDTGPPPEPPPTPTGKLVLVGSMSEGRSSHTSTRLASGDVLVAGGWRDSTTVTEGVEIYNTATRAFNALLTGLRVPRANHTATLLGDGTVLITGGMIEGGYKVTEQTEIYNPGTRTFTVGPDMTQKRAYHRATMLKDGRVLITGGAEYNASSGLISVRTAEVYDPLTGQFTSLPNMGVYRSDHQATPLLDGKVLITGGHSTSTTAELFDPSKDAFAATTNPMKVARSGHSATRLIGGNVLIYGGGSRSAEIYTPGVSRFDGTPGTPLKDRTSHTADILATGRVLITGGYEWVTSLIFHATIEYFNGPPGDKTFVMASDMLTFPRTNHRSTVLKNGDVLITGGASLDPLLPELSSAALYTFK